MVVQASCLYFMLTFLRFCSLFRCCVYLLTFSGGLCSLTEPTSVIALVEHLVSSRASSCHVFACFQLCSSVLHLLVCFRIVSDCMAPKIGECFAPPSSDDSQKCFKYQQAACRLPQGIYTAARRQGEGTESNGMKLL